MKKILFALLCTFPFLFAGCGEESTTTTGGDISKPVTETAEFTQSAFYSILKTNKNTTASAIILGASKSAGDTVTVTFTDVPAENFTVTQGYYFDNAYGVAVYSNSKTTSIDTFNVSVKNRLGTEILNEKGYIFSVHKIYPYYTDAQSNNFPIPYPDNNIFTFNTAGESKTILFKQVVTENNKSYGDGQKSDSSADLPVYITSYGFDSQNLNNTATYNNFTVDTVSETLDYNGTMYPNCLTYKRQNDCAIKITNDNTAVESNAVFYMRINEKYVDTAIKLKSIAQ